MDAQIKRDKPYFITCLIVMLACLAIFLLLATGCIVKDGSPKRDTLWLYADVSSGDRNDFTGNYKAYDGLDSDITEDSEVWFKLEISGGDLYYDDFGGSLDGNSCGYFAAASDLASLRVDSMGDVARIDLHIGVNYKSYYPQ